MLLRLVVLVGLPLIAYSFLFPSSGGGCCCQPSCGSSCGSGCGGGYSGNYGGSYGGYSGGYSGGYASSGGYAQPSGGYVSAGSVGHSQGGYVSTPQIQSYGAAPSAPVSYNAAPAASEYNSGPAIPPPPPSANEVSPSPYIGHAAASGDKIQAVEDDEASAAAELNAVASSLNATTPSEPSPAIDISLLKLTNDTECNSEELREIINNNMTENLNSSKRLIQLASEEKFGGRFDVICSTSDFSYVTNTELFCQQTQNHVSCYAYRQL